MKSLLKFWPGVSKELGRSPHRLLLFDFDGTLSAIALTPGRATLPANIRENLRRLAGRRDCTVGIVSGRSVRDVRRLVRLPGLIYVGNHGLEIENNGWGFVHPRAKACVPGLHHLEQSLRKSLRGIPGVLIENKILSISVHFRRASARHRARILSRVRAATAAKSQSGDFELRGGKQVIEIRPLVHWDKGSAVGWLKRFVPRHASILYIGDDKTDEDAFQILKSGGISVRVGRRRDSHARFFLRHQADIQTVLSMLNLIPQKEKA